MGAKPHLEWAPVFAKCLLVVREEMVSHWNTIPICSCQKAAHAPRRACLATFQIMACYE